MPKLTKEESLKVIFDKSAQEVKGGKNPIVAIREVASIIENTRLHETAGICALLRAEMGPRLNKGARWFGKYLDAKYKQPQAPHGEAKGAAEGSTSSSTEYPTGDEVKQVKTEKCPECGAENANPEDLGELECKECHETFHPDTEAAPTPKKKTRLRVDWEKPSNEGRTPEKNPKDRCARCNHMRHHHKGNSNSPEDGPEACQVLWTDKKVKTARGCTCPKFVESDQEKRLPTTGTLEFGDGHRIFIAEIGIEDKDESLRKALGLKKRQAMQVHQKVKCPICGQATEFMMGIYPSSISQEAENIRQALDGKSWCPAPETDKDGKLAPSQYKAAVFVELEGKNRCARIFNEYQGGLWAQVTNCIFEVEEEARETAKFLGVKSDIQATSEILTTKQELADAKAALVEPSDLKRLIAGHLKQLEKIHVPETPKPAEDEAKGSRDGQPEADSVGKTKKGSKKKEPIKQVERTEEEGYNAYPGDASKKLDQPMFSEKEYSFDEIMATRVFTYKADPVDARYNTHICGNCGSSKLDWTSMVLNHWENQEYGKKFLCRAKHFKNTGPVYSSIGFFQCATCHAFLFNEKETPWLRVAKQPDGSYKFDGEIGKLTAQDVQDKKPEDLEEALELLAMARSELARKPAEQKADILSAGSESQILHVLLEGPALDKDHPLRDVQVRLLATGDYDAIKNELLNERQKVATIARDLDGMREQLAEVKKQIKLRATPEETATLETLRTENDELKDELKRCQERELKDMITTADQLHEITIFLPRKQVMDLTKEVDRLNWDKKLPGLVFTTDGHFVQKVKAGVPPE